MYSSIESLTLTSLTCCQAARDELTESKAKEEQGGSWVQQSHLQARPAEEAAAQWQRRAEQAEQRCVRAISAPKTTLLVCCLRGWWTSQKHDRDVLP